MTLFPFYPTVCKRHNGCLPSLVISTFPVLRKQPRKIYSPTHMKEHSSQTEITVRGRESIKDNRKKKHGLCFETRDWGKLFKVWHLHLNDSKSGGAGEMTQWWKTLSPLQRARVQFRHTHGSSRLSATLVPGNLMPSSGLDGHQACMVP